MAPCVLAQGAFFKFEIKIEKILLFLISSFGHKKYSLLFLIFAAIISIVLFFFLLVFSTVNHLY